MDPAVIAALITGPATAILAGAFTYLLSEDRLQRSRLTRARRAALTGRWQGMLLQEVFVETTPTEGKLALELRCGWRTVKGTGVLQTTLDGEERLNRFYLRGGFLFDRFLRMEYKNEKGHVVQFGSVVLELSPEGNELNGRYAGYGVISVDNVSGTVKLKKDE